MRTLSFSCAGSFVWQIQYYIIYPLVSSFCSVLHSCHFVPFIVTSVSCLFILLTCGESRWLIPHDMLHSAQVMTGCQNRTVTAHAASVYIYNKPQWPRTHCKVSGVTTAIKCENESPKLSFHMCTEFDSLLQWLTLW